jgi:hypothetical protein
MSTHCRGMCDSHAPALLRVRARYRRRLIQSVGRGSFHLRLDAHVLLTWVACRGYIGTTRSRPVFAAISHVWRTMVRLVCEDQGQHSYGCAPCTMKLRVRSLLSDPARRGRIVRSTRRAMVSPARAVFSISAPRAAVPLAGSEKTRVVLSDGCLMRSPLGNTQR